LCERAGSGQEHRLKLEKKNLSALLELRWSSSCGQWQLSPQIPEEEYVYWVYRFLYLEFKTLSFL